MLYAELAEVYSRLEETPGKLEKTEIIAKVMKGVDEELLGIISQLLMGRVFPEWSGLELGVGPSMLYEAIAFVCGVAPKDVKRAVAEAGDAGSAAEELLKRKVQQTLIARRLSVREVYSTFERIARASGKGSHQRKLKLLAELLSHAEPLEARYIVRTVLGELRVGVAEGLVRDAIALAFSVPASAVERAYMLCGDFGEVARRAKHEGEEGLRSIRMKPGTPVKPMLAQLAPSLEKVLQELGTAAVEVKYDGARVQIHKRGEELWIFSRRLENVTSALPDVAERAKRCITATTAVVEGEAVAVDPETGKPRAFQEILRRFRRKYDVGKMVAEIPFEVFLFDALYIDGEMLIDLSFEERRRRLEGAVKPERGFELAEQLITGSAGEAEAFYEKALEMGHEGIMLKSLRAPYVPGARVGYMYKLKPVMETLDLVITGAVWGTGKRAGWLSSYELSARDEDTGELLPVGRVGTGVTEEQLQEFTEMLRPLIISQEAEEVRLMPKVVVEVAYQEIQRSPNYASGFALRFPRVVRVREDKSPEEADTLQRVRELYESQRQAP